MRSNSTMTLDEITRVCTVSYAKSLRACAVSQGRLLETFLETKDLALLLEEDEVAFTDDDANALKAAIDDLKQKVSDVKKLNDSALGGKMSGSVSNIESLMGEVPDVSQIASLATAGEGEKLKAALEELNEPINKVGESIAIITQAFQDVAQNIAAAAKGITDEQKKMTVGELAEKAKNKELKTEDGKDIDFPDPDAIKKGASKALVTPSWFQKAIKSGMDAAKSDSGGFFDKAVSFMKGLFGGGGSDKLIDPDTFATEFMELTLEELEAGAKASSDIAGAMQETVASNAEATGAAQASAAAEAEGGDDAKDGELPDSAKKAEKRPDFSIEDLIKLLAIQNASAAKALEALPEEEQEAAVADDLEQIQGGEVSPEDALGDVADEAEAAADAPKWSDISKDFLDDLSDEAKPDGEAIASSLKDDEEFAKKAGASINMSESFVPSSLPMTILLREDIAFDDIMTAASSVLDDEDAAKASATKLAQTIVDAGVEVSDVPAEDEDVEAKEVEAALDELEPGLASYIDDNQDIIAKALADLLKGNEEIAAKVTALLAADEGERSGEAEEVADLADDAGVEMDDLDAAIEQGIETATSELNDEIKNDLGSVREELAEALTSAEEAENEELDAQIEELLGKAASDLGAEPGDFKDALEDDDKFAEFFMTLEDKSIDDVKGAVEELKTEVESALEEAGVAEEGEGSKPGEMSPEEKEEAEAAAAETGDALQQALDDDDEAKGEEAEELIDAAAQELDISGDDLKGAIEDPGSNLEQLVKDQELEIEKLQNKIEELDNEINDMMGREIKDEPGNLSDDEKEELAQDLEDITQDFEDLEGEDSEEALGVIEDPAKDLGVSPEEFGDALKDIEALDDLVTDKELKFSDVKDQLAAADEELEGGGEGEEDDPGAVEKLAQAAADAAADPEDSEEAVEDAINKAIEDWEAQLSDRQQKRINAQGRLDQLKQAVADATPPQVDPPADPDEVAKAGQDWATQNKIDDPKSPLGNPKNFSPKQMQKLIDLFPQIVQDVQGEEGEEGDDKGEKNTYARNDFEKKLEDALKSASPELADADGGIMAAALADWIMNNDVTEVVLESKDFSKILLEKYDYKAIADFMKGEIGDLAKELGYEGKEDAVLADFLRAVAPVLGEEGIEVDGIPDDSTEDDGGDEGKPQSEDEMAETDSEAESATAAAEKEAESKGLSPAEGAQEIVAKWAESGKTLAKNVSQKQREKLKGTLAPILDTAADKLKGEVEKAVDDWRGAQKVLQKPNVSDKQIDTLKQSLSDFISTVVRSEARDPSQAKRSLVTKIHKFLITEAGYTRSEIKVMDQYELLHSFVHSYCNIQMHSLDRRGMMTEVLDTPTKMTSSSFSEKPSDRWARLAGL